MEHIELFQKLETGSNYEESKLLIENSIEFSVNKNLDGGAEILEFVFYLTPFAIGTIAKIILERIKSNRFKKIKINRSKVDEFDNIEISGLSESAIKSILNKYLKNEDYDD